MSMKIYYVLLIMILPILAAAQQEGDVWVFGTGSGIDFSTGTPVSFSSSCTGAEGTASVSTSDGELLFYSNGKSVWNKEHDLMPGGASLMASDPSSTSQASAIVPVPGSDNLFYVFSLEALGSAGGLYYSIVDMTLDGGLGDVVAAETGVLIDDDMCEKMTVVAGQCENAWLIVHSASVNEYYSYEITEDGISAPVVSVIGTGEFESGYEVGVIKVSSDRTKMIASLYPGFDIAENAAEMYNFDPVTGIISDREVLIDASSDLWAGGYYYGASFSPDDSKAYFSNGTQLVQFDLSLGTLAAIISSGTFIANVAYGDMKVAPDGKIYVVSSFGSTLSTINSPNLAGTSCDYDAGSYTLSGTVTFGLPNVVVVPVVALDSNSIAVHDITSCSNVTISGRGGSTEFEWSTGATTESITVTPPGTYWVISKQGCAVMDTFHVALGTVEPPLVSVSDVMICPEQQFLPVHAEAKGTGVLSYAWSPAAAISSGINEADAIVNTFLAQKVFVTVTNQDDLCTATTKDTININNFPPIVFDLLNNDTLVCQNETVILNVEGPDVYSYNWLPEGRIADPDAQQTSVYTGPTAFYSISAKDANGCVSSDSFLLATKPCCTILIPNAFSPNGDGKNDVLQLKGETDQRINEFSIFNRLGQRLFTSNKQDDVWDGTFSGKECDLGVYYYYLRYTCSDGNEYIRKGDITLLR